MKQRHIVAASGGFKPAPQGNIGQSEFGPIVRYAVSLTAQARPRICYIGTATGDSTLGIVSFYDACSTENVQASHLQLFSKPNVSDVRTHLLSQDMIWVQGGSVANLLAVWRVHGLDEILREAWEQGIVLAGTSAGSICWHAGGTTDSFGLPLRPVTDGLGFLPYSNGVHHDSEPERRPLFQQLIREGTLPAGYATDDGTALHFIDTDLHQAIADTPGKFVYHVTEDGETKLEPKLLTFGR